MLPTLSPLLIKEHDILHFLVWEKTTFPLYIPALYYTHVLDWSSHNSLTFDLALDLVFVIIKVNEMGSYPSIAVAPYLGPV